MVALGRGEGCASAAGLASGAATQGVSHPGPAPAGLYTRGVSDWVQNLGGRFIVFDGADGCGKSTQLERLVELASGSGVGVCRVREPGGTKVGEAIRQVLLDREQDDMTVRAEMLLYMASRAQLCERVIGPALARGELVLADRFLSSTLAYQGAGGGLADADIMAVGRIATGGIEPDLTVILDIDDKTAAKRLGGGGKQAAVGAGSLFADRMETKGDAYRERVRVGYRKQVDGARCVLVSAAGEPEAVFERVVEAIQARAVAWTAAPDGS